MKVVVMDAVNERVKEYDTPWDFRFAAILFRKILYVATPNHMDARKMIEASMSKLAMQRAYNRVVDGKETMLFGFAYLDKETWVWEHCPEYQEARMTIYVRGF